MYLYTGSKTALCSSTWALVYLHLGSPDRSSVPRDVQEASPADFGAISDPSGRLWKPQNTVKYKVFAIFHVAPQTSSRSSKSAPWKAQNDPQEAPRSGPGRPRSGQEGPKTAPRAPEASQERPQSRPKTASERPWRPSWAHLYKKVVSETFHGPFWTQRGPTLHPPGVDFRTAFLFGKHSQSCPVGKACASLRPAPLYLLV